MAEEAQTYQPDGYGDTYQGMDFDTFRALDDETVDRLRAAHNEAVDTTPIMSEAADGAVSFTEDGGQLFDEGAVLRRFIYWRRYGVPDREVTRADVDQYLRDLVAARKAEDAHYGELPASFQQWSQEAVSDLRYLYGYFSQMRSHSEPLTIDSYSLTSTIGFDESNIQGFVERGVLARIGDYTAPDEQTYHTYQLCSPYYDRLLVHWYGRREGA